LFCTSAQYLEADNTDELTSEVVSILQSNDRVRLIDLINQRRHTDEYEVPQYRPQPVQASSRKVSPRRLYGETNVEVVDYTDNTEDAPDKTNPEQLGRQKFSIPIDANVMRKKNWENVVDKTDDRDKKKQDASSF